MDLGCSVGRPVRVSAGKGRPDSYGFWATDKATTERGLLMASTASPRGSGGFAPLKASPGSSGESCHSHYRLASNLLLGWGLFYSGPELRDPRNVSPAGDFARKNGTQ